MSRRADPEWVELRHRLIELRSELRSLGATVGKLPDYRVQSGRLRGIVAGEAERVRVLTSPEGRGRRD
jgi:hypothetical protein